MNIRTSTHFAFFALALASAQLASADTILPTENGRAEFGTAVVADASNGFRLAVGPVDGVNRAFRSYLTFDLTSATTASAVTVDLFDAGANESNDTGFTQDFTLFQLGSDWDGGIPNPGTDLATVSVTLAANPDQGLSFSSAALTSAYNTAVGGTLFLGLYAPDGETAVAGTRSFLWLSSLESSVDATPAGSDSGARPSLTYTPVPEPSAALLLGGLGVLMLLRRRR